MMRVFLLAVILLASAVPSVAQEPVIPIRYRVTRTAPAQPTIQHTFLKSAMTCDLAVLSPDLMLPGWLRITDPERDTRDCQWVDSAGTLTAGMVREVAYSFTAAGQANDIDPYGPESEPWVLTLPRIPQIPGAPQNPRYIPPGTPTVAVLGTVQSRGPAFGLDVASSSLDGLPGFAFHFGAMTLTVPGVYSVTPGDRFVLQLWRP